MAATKIYTKARDPRDDEKLGEHMSAILFALRNGPQPREKVVAAVEKRLEGKTVMAAGRIVSFHAPRMVARGLLKIKVEKAEKAPKKAAADE